MGAPPTVKWTEEVARFAFEVYVTHHLHNELYVAFANPTAGPWKTVKMKDPTGASIEVHRFGIHDQRPDLMVVDPTTDVVLILEAKDAVERLVPATQIAKARDAYNTVWQSLRAEPRHELVPANISAIPAFLWASQSFPRETRSCQAALETTWPQAAREAVFVGVADLDKEAHIHLLYSGRGHPPSIFSTLAQSERSTVH